MIAKQEKFVCRYQLASLVMLTFTLQFNTVCSICLPFSRAGYKLEAALNYFGIDVSGKRVLDAGISTGGFTDCLLQRGASCVVGVDVGYGQVPIIFSAYATRCLVTNLSFFSISCPCFLTSIGEQQ